MKRQLRVQGLAVGHGTRTLVHGLDFGLEQGELVCLIGRNGAGKSTLLRTLCGLQQPMAGSVQLDGVNIHSLSPRERALHIAAMLPGRLTAGQVTVAEALRMATFARTGWTGGLHTDVVDLIRDITVTVGFKGSEDRLLGTLSDGEHQLVMIARALAQCSSFVLLDEPTAHLDLTARATVMRALRQLTDEADYGLLLSSHDLHSALAVSDRLLIVRRDGRCWQGTPDEARATGVIAQEFDEDGVRFDPTTGNFIMG